MGMFIEAHSFCEGVVETMHLHPWLGDGLNDGLGESPIPRWSIFALRTYLSRRRHHDFREAFNRTFTKAQHVRYGRTQRLVRVNLHRYCFAMALASRDEASVAGTDFGD